MSAFGQHEQEHLTRIEAALFNTYDLADVVRYLEEKTYLKGDRFSFEGHEFQKDILSDTSKVLYVQKCAQVGLSEAMARYALGVTRIMPYFSVIMTMPFANDASNFTKARLDPIIDESPDLREAVDKDNNSAEIKGLGTGLLYMRGCSGSTAALSVPADMVIHDEVDRSDEDVLGQFQSRLRHSQWKLTRRFGTPTMEGKGIALDMKTARRMRHACSCNHCGETFVPSFHTDVKIPDYTGRFQDINKYNLEKTRWREARLHCPSCDAEPSLAPEHRSWICENPGDQFEAIGYYVTPFSIPGTTKVPDLVKEITKYKTWSEFVNQALGETADDSETQLSENDISEAMNKDSDLNSSEMHNMGIDVGQICHVLIGRMTQLGELLVVHKERVKLADLKLRKAELKRQYRVLITVIDSMPETHLVHLMQKSDKNLYGGVYRDNRKLATYEIVLVDKDLKAGKLAIHQAAICRDVNFDEVMALYKSRLLRWQQSTGADDMEDVLFKEHMLDMKRTQVFNKKTREITYTWAKSSAAQDHYMHTLGYLHVACRLAPTASKNAHFGGFPTVHVMKVTEKKTTREIMQEAMTDRRAIR